MLSNQLFSIGFWNSQLMFLKFPASEFQNWTRKSTSVQKLWNFINSLCIHIYHKKCFLYENKLIFKTWHKVENNEKLQCFSSTLFTTINGDFYQLIYNTKVFKTLFSKLFKNYFVLKFLTIIFELYAHKLYKTFLMIDQINYSYIKYDFSPK